MRLTRRAQRQTRAEAPAAFAQARVGQRARAALAGAGALLDLLNRPLSVADVAAARGHELIVQVFELELDILADWCRVGNAKAGDTAPGLPGSAARLAGHPQ